LFQDDLYPNTTLLANLTHGEHQCSTPMENPGVYTLVVCKWGPIIGVGVAHFYLDACEVASHDLLRRLDEETAPLIAIQHIVYCSPYVNTGTDKSLTGLSAPIFVHFC